jgi:cobalt-precorrin 5A hydrolase
VSLVSGHLGGANDLARSVALVTGGSAVISTATDLAGAPALEIVARDLGLVPESLRPLPAAAAALVDGAPLPVYDPMGLFLPALAQWPDLFIPAGDPGRLPEGGPSVSVDCRLRDLPSGCLALRPPVLAAGLGCHRDCPPEVLSDLLLAALREAGLSPKSVAVLATIDRRASAELAPAALSAAWGKPLIGYEPRALAGVDVPTPSEAVARNIGVASVCEAAAILAARGGPLLAPKRKGEGATCALALIRST